MLKNIANITKAVPLKTISNMGINNAEIALNYVQGGASTVPLRFVAGYNLDHVIKIHFAADDIIRVIYNEGTNVEYGFFKKETTGYDEMYAYLQTQKVMGSGEIATMLKELKTPNTNE